MAHKEDEMPGNVSSHIAASKWNKSPGKSADSAEALGDPGQNVPAFVLPCKAC